MNENRYRVVWYDAETKKRTQFSMSSKTAAFHELRSALITLPLGSHGMVRKADSQTRGSFILRYEKIAEDTLRLVRPAALQNHFERRAKQKPRSFRIYSPVQVTVQELDEMSIQEAWPDFYGKTFAWFRDENEQSAGVLLAQSMTGVWHGTVKAFYSGQVKELFARIAGLEEKTLGPLPGLLYRLAEIGTIRIVRQYPRSIVAPQDFVAFMRAACCGKIPFGKDPSEYFKCGGLLWVGDK